MYSDSMACGSDRCQYPTCIVSQHDSGVRRSGGTLQRCWWRWSLAVRLKLAETFSVAKAKSINLFRGDETRMAESEWDSLPTPSGAKIGPFSGDCTLGGFDEKSVGMPKA